nr:hypothetical protein [Clostridia bacterium]
GDDDAVLNCMKEVTAQTQPNTPAEPGEQEQGESVIQRLIKGITSFFLRVVDFFKRVFAAK